MSSSPHSTAALRDQTIRDFGEQWTAYTENTGYYASVDLLDDIFAGLLDAGALRGKRVADIGSGTGRIVGMLVAAGVADVTAVEPSDAYHVLEQNTQAVRDRVRCVRGRGEDLPGDAVYDYVVSIGVLHHVPDPSPIVQRAKAALRPGGRLLVWLYAREGNELYLSLARPLRAVSRHLPHRALELLSAGLSHPLNVYIGLCARFPALPMADYMSEHIGRLDSKARILTIYDQLNPAYAKYYRQDEAVALLRDAGFADVQARRRHGYSWTVVGTRT